MGLTGLAGQIQNANVRMTKTWLFGERMGDIIDKSSLRLEYDRNREIKGQDKQGFWLS